MIYSHKQVCDNGDEVEVRVEIENNCLIKTDAYYKREGKGLSQLATYSVFGDRSLCMAVSIGCGIDFEDHMNALNVIHKAASLFETLSKIEKDISFDSVLKVFDYTAVD